MIVLPPDDGQGEGALSPGKRQDRPAKGLYDPFQSWQPLLRDILGQAVAALALAVVVADGHVHVVLRANVQRGLEAQDLLEHQVDQDMHVATADVLQGLVHAPHGVGVQTGADGVAAPPAGVFHGFQDAVHVAQLGGRLHRFTDCRLVLFHVSSFLRDWRSRYAGGELNRRRPKVGPPTRDRLAGLPTVPQISVVPRLIEAQGARLLLPSVVERVRQLNPLCATTIDGSTFPFLSKIWTTVPHGCGGVRPRRPARNWDLSQSWIGRPTPPRAMRVHPACCPCWASWVPSVTAGDPVNPSLRGG